MDYMAELNEVAEDEATREGAPQPVEFTESDLKSIVPVFKDDDEDSDEEEARLREHLQADFDDAADADWSPVHSEATENIPGIDEWEAIEDSRPDIVHNIFDREDNVESHTEVDYGADQEEAVEQVDEFADAIVIQDDAMDVDKNEAETKEDAGALDDVMVIEEPETGHPAVEVTTEESQAPETEEAVAGGDPVPVVDVEETGGKVATSETVAAGANTATAEGSKLAGRPANVEKAASSSMKPKPEVKKMPLSHHTAKAPTEMIDDAAKLKLEQAKERLEDSVWLDPTDLNSRIPYKNVNANGRLREISGKMSMYLRGHALPTVTHRRRWTSLTCQWIGSSCATTWATRSGTWLIGKFSKSFAAATPDDSSCKFVDLTMRKPPGRVCRGSRFVSELTKDTTPLCSRRENLLPWSVIFTHWIRISQTKRLTRVTSPERISDPISSRNLTASPGSSTILATRGLCHRSSNMAWSREGGRSLQDAPTATSLRRTHGTPTWRSSRGREPESHSM